MGDVMPCGCDTSELDDCPHTQGGKERRGALRSALRPVVCLVGSTKPEWQDRYKDVNRELTLAGYVVISVAMFRPDVPDIEAHRDLLEDIHFQKMDMADVVVLIHVNAVGTHTALEIARCNAQKKPVVVFTTVSEADREIQAALRGDRL